MFEFIVETLYKPDLACHGTHSRGAILKEIDSSNKEERAVGILGGRQDGIGREGLLGSQ